MLFVGRVITEIASATISTAFAYIADVTVPANRANFFGHVAHHVLPTVFVLYGAYRYGWNETTVGLTLAAGIVPVPPSSRGCWSVLPWPAWASAGR